MKFHFSVLPRVLLGALLSLPVVAQAELVLKSEALQEVAVKGKDGKVQKKRQAVTTATPGTEVIYVITYRNTGTQPANAVVVNNPIPAGMRYQAGSAEGAGARSEVSVDGGKQYGALETLRVKNADGTMRPARGEDVTHARWTVLGAVPAGKDGSVSYRAVVK
ncbi:MAG: conserved repeat domain protein [Moraxellaceae bacterium]|jgi:uncharacterized repeat protein (TIGR01451 family)|nr:conserved repeat domain protein [Moraxellaceae bacterium]